MMGSENSKVRILLLESAVRRLNERGLELIKKAAQAVDGVNGVISWKETLILWARADKVTLDRAARCPMALLDFNFQRVAWWGRVINGQPLEGSRQPKWAAFHTDEAIPLAHDLLLEAWSAARSLSHVSSLVFGMAPEVARLIAQLSPRDVDRVVAHEIQDLRPRWENRPVFWRELLLAARSMDDRDLAKVHLHCLQLFGGELISTLVKPLAANAPRGQRAEDAVVKT
jgi:hypothetical protein